MASEDQIALPPPLLLSYPRSMSSLTASIISQSLPQYSYPPAASGEVLHWTQMSYWTQSYEQRSSYYAKYFSVLDQCYKKNMIVKDVHQPYVCQAYIDKYPDRFTPIMFRRPLEDIMYRCLQIGWYWSILGSKNSQAPLLFQKAEVALRKESVSEEELIHFVMPLLARGLIDTNRRFYECIDKKLYFCYLINDPNYLYEQLGEWGFNPTRIDYINDGFIQTRQQVLAYRETSLWKKCYLAIKRYRDELEED